MDQPMSGYNAAPVVEQRRDVGSSARSGTASMRPSMPQCHSNVSQQVYRDRSGPRSCSCFQRSQSLAAQKRRRVVHWPVTDDHCSQRGRLWSSIGCCCQPTAAVVTRRLEDFPALTTMYWYTAGVPLLQSVVAVLPGCSNQQESAAQELEH